MKRSFILLFIFVLLLIPTGCKDDSADGDNGTEESVETVTQYVYKAWYTGVYAYSNEADLGKKDKEIKEKKWLKIAQKVTVKSKKNIGEKSYYFIQLADTSEYWIKADNLVEKFITINQNDLPCYDQPGDEEVPTHRLQPGDFGAFIEVSKNNPDFMKVDFIAYRGLNPESKQKWVGKKWIKGGYTDNLMVARQSYYLALAYGQLNAKTPSKDKALGFLEDALDATAGQKTEITDVIINLQQELSGSDEIVESETTDGEM